jgi:DNA-binding IclR family transcriptional regulator
VPDPVAQRSHRDVRRLIAEHVHSVGALDLLVLLRDDRGRSWTAGEIADALDCPAPWAERELAQLRAGGLVKADGEGRYAYRPHSARLAKAMDALARAYATDTREVVRLIFAKRG